MVQVQNRRCRREDLEFTIRNLLYLAEFAGHTPNMVYKRRPLIGSFEELAGFARPTMNSIELAYSSGLRAFLTNPYTLMQYCRFGSKKEESTLRLFAMDVNWLGRIVILSFCHLC